MSTVSQVLARFDKLILQGEETRTATHRTTAPPLNSNPAYQTFVVPGPATVESGKFHEFRSASLSLLNSVFEEKHTYFKEFNVNCKTSFLVDTINGIHIMKAARQEVADGYLLTVKNILRAEVFSDFLEMAEHLLEQGWKDAAAVMIGSVLENHLRELAVKHNLPTNFEKDNKQIPKKSDTLNADLKKADVYESLDQKAVTMWLGLRNNAAHGEYTLYTAEQVENMLSGVLEFVRRVSLR